jgi:hypothetical protein
MNTAHACHARQGCQITSMTTIGHHMLVKVGASYRRQLTCMGQPSIMANRDQSTFRPCPGNSVSGWRWAGLLGWAGTITRGVQGKAGVQSKWRHGGKVCRVAPP